MPESIQVAVSAPMESRMMMAELVLPRFSPTFSSKVRQGTLRPYRPMRQVRTAEAKMAIWEGPPVSSSPKINTPTISRAIRNSTGTSDRRSPGFFISYSIFFLRKIRKTTSTIRIMPDRMMAMSQFPPTRGNLTFMP